MRPIYFTTAFLAAVLALSVSTDAQARRVKAPTIESGVITSCSDADSFRLKREDGSVVKVRLHFADAPEVAHNKKESDQPGGREALDWVRQNWEGKTVTVTVRGHSYDRIVGDVVAKDTGANLGLDLVRVGLAVVDPRYRPPKEFREAEAAAKLNHLGIFKNTQTPVTPWDWRKKQRER